MVPSRNPSLTLVVLVTSGSYSHNFFVCLWNVISEVIVFPERLPDLVLIPWKRDIYSGLMQHLVWLMLTCLSSLQVHEEETWLFKMIHVFTTLPVRLPLTSGLWKNRRQKASERKMRLKEPRNYSWVFFVIKEFPCVQGILNLGHVFSQLWKVGVTHGK